MYGIDVTANWYSNADRKGIDICYMHVCVEVGSAEEQKLGCSCLPKSSVMTSPG